MAEYGNNYDYGLSPFYLDDNSYDKTLSPTRIYMHDYVCKMGNHKGETYAAYSVSKIAMMGQKTVTLSSVTGLVVGQLMAYSNTITDLSSFYSTKIAGISGNDVTFEDNLRTLLDTGNKIYAWYVNSTHPSEQGMASIVSHAKRYLIDNVHLGDKAVFFEKYGDALGTDAVAVATASIATQEINDPLCIGFPNYPEIDITVNADGDGAYLLTASQSGGQYSYDICYNPGTALSTVSLLITIGAVTLVSESYVSEGSSIKHFTGSFITEDTGQIKIQMTQTDGNLFSIGWVRVCENMPVSDVLNSGTHVIYGDSWGDFAYTQSAFEDAYPDATFINGSTGGDTCALANLHFDANVTPNSPDYVWIFIGTNDVNVGVSQADFEEDLNELILKCVTIGAKPIVFDCSVYPPAGVDYTDTNLSHEYERVTQYNYDYGTVHVSGYFDTGSKWQIKVVTTGVTTSLMSFAYPFLLSDIPDSFLNASRTDYMDIHVYDSNGIERSRYIQQNAGVLNWEAPISTISSTFYIEGGSLVQQANDGDVWHDAVQAFMFDENSGTAIADATGNGDGVLADAGSDVTLGIAGPIGNSIEFKGGTSTITVADRDNLSFGGAYPVEPFSMSAWFKMGSGMSMNIIKKQTGQSEYHTGYYTGYPRILKFTSDSIYIGRRTTNAPSVDTWHRIDCINRKDTVVIVYIDGVVESAYTNISGGTYTGMLNGTAPFQIAPYASNNCEGSLCRLILRNVELSSSDVAALTQYESNISGQYTVTEVYSSVTPAGGGLMISTGIFV